MAFAAANVDHHLCAGKVIGADRGFGRPGRLHVDRVVIRTRGVGIGGEVGVVRLAVGVLEGGASTPDR